LSDIGEHIVELFSVARKRQVEHNFAGGTGERVL
jgi:hypothetical protein